MTKQPDDILKEMELILKQIIGIAEKLQGLSAQVISKEELLPLQKEQQKLLQNLVSNDKAFEKASKGKRVEEMETPLAKNILTLLEEFQELNAAFISNLSNKQELINFEDQEESNDSTD